MVYYNLQDNKLMPQSFCFISDDLTHDTVFVHVFFAQLSTLIPNLSSTIAKVEYLVDGCARQYKNYKNILNLCYHKSDFKLEASWAFFASSLGKSLSDLIE